MKFPLHVQRRLMVFGLTMGIGITTLLYTSTNRVYGDDECDTAMVERVRSSREREMKIAVEFVEGLELTRMQAKRLMPIIEQAAALHNDHFEQVTSYLPLMVEYFSDFEAEDKLNQGFSPNVENRTAVINHKFKTANENWTDKLIELEKQVSKILTSSQLDYAEYYRPGQAKTQIQNTRNINRRTTQNNNVANKRLQDPLHAAQMELDELNRELYPRVNNVGRYLFNPVVYENVCSIAHQKISKNMQYTVELLTNGSSEYPTSLLDQHLAQVNQLRTDINNWNLLNGLQISVDQTEKLLAAYDNTMSEARQRTGWWVDSLNPTPDLKVKLEREVENILTPGQCAVLSTYKACLIPPKNLKDPVRVGQANDNSQYEIMLDRARKSDKELWPRMVDTLLDKEAEHFGKLNNQDRQRRKIQIINMLKKSAAMSDAEFEISKAELAEQVAPNDRKMVLREEIDSLARERELATTTSRFILNPDFISQLRQRGEQLRAGMVYADIDLAAGPQAENCEEGCALKEDK